MNRVHIILWGQESGLISKDQCANEQTIAQIEDFANLVAANDRECHASMVESMGVEGYGTLAIAAAIRQRKSNDTPKL
jgi:hypothetical protein